MADFDLRGREGRLTVTFLEKCLPVYPLYLLRKTVLYTGVVSLGFHGWLFRRFGFNVELSVEDRSVWVWDLQDRLTGYRLERKDKQL